MTYISPVTSIEKRIQKKVSRKKQKQRVASAATPAAPLGGTATSAATAAAADTATSVHATAATAAVVDAATAAHASAAAASASADAAAASPLLPFAEDAPAPAAAAATDPATTAVEPTSTTETTTAATSADPSPAVSAELGQSSEPAAKRAKTQGRSEPRRSSEAAAPTPEVISREVLQLSLVEAFFLKHGLACLNIVDTRGRVLSTTACWRLFCETCATFAQDYVVYHSLRSYGWVPKTGLKFAVDYTAYRQGPAFYHSSYSVLVRTAWEDTLAPWNPAEEENVLQWSYLSNIGRMAAQVGRDLSGGNGGMVELA
jgi:tRNA splicing endonuclease